MEIKQMILHSNHFLANLSHVSLALRRNAMSSRLLSSSVDPSDCAYMLNSSRASHLAWAVSLSRGCTKTYSPSLPITAHCSSPACSHAHLACLGRRLPSSLCVPLPTCESPHVWPRDERRESLCCVPCHRSPVNMGSFQLHSE